MTKRVSVNCGMVCLKSGPRGSLALLATLRMYEGGTDYGVWRPLGASVLRDRPPPPPPSVLVCAIGLLREPKAYEHGRSDQILFGGPDIFRGHYLVITISMLEIWGGRPYRPVPGTRTIGVLIRPCGPEGLSLCY